MQVRVLSVDDELRLYTFYFTIQPLQWFAKFLISTVRRGSLKLQP